MNDRGTKKWTSLMLPEHLEALKNLFVERASKKRPILDEQQIIENESILQHAIHDHLTVEITYFEDCDLHRIQGEIINIVDNYLLVDHVKVQLKNIIEVNYT